MQKQIHNGQIKNYFLNVSKTLSKNKNMISKFLKLQQINQYVLTSLTGEHLPMPQRWHMHHGNGLLMPVGLRRTIL